MEMQKRGLRKPRTEPWKDMDYILDVFSAPDFVEVVGRMGGDTVTYRVYDDGSVYER